jgi:hypothetical protein
MKRAVRIGVIGPGDANPDELRMAEAVGRGIAERGGIVVCGGLGGAMEAVARGAAQAGGFTIGILPGHDPDSANLYISLPVVTGMSHARNLVNVLTSQAVIAVGGAYGTLSEIALALKSRRPVVALKSWRLKEIGCDDALFMEAETPAEAIEKAFAAAGSAL